MGRFISEFLDNESSFGRLMTRCGIIIGANFMFIIFSWPIITMGPALVALHHVMLKVLRGDGVLNPFKEFWAGFKSNFKQAMIYWLILIGIIIFGVIDVRFCAQMGGVLKAFQYAIYAIGIIVLAISIYMMPVMAAFADTIPHLMRNALFFVARNPIRLLIILFFNVFPLYLTYTDAQMQPLYAFLWAMFGFGAIAMLTSTLLINDFNKYLPKVDAFGYLIEDGEEEMGALEAKDVKQPTEKEVLSDMEKLGM